MANLIKLPAGKGIYTADEVADLLRGEGFEVEFEEDEAKKPSVESER